MAIKFHKPQMYAAIAKTNIFSVLSHLLATYPWNNFLQLKLMNIFEDTIENIDNAEFREIGLRKSELGKVLMDLSGTTYFRFNE